MTYLKYSLEFLLLSIFNLLNLDIGTRLQFDGTTLKEGEQAVRV